ncbi:Trichohyalin-plectin-homology domain-containing protein [Plasmodiophora brassicae]|uniref:Uncharacterized protein n=1 Tax=Plasmodiophora brassicae TaxID=37360 RepID=A0A0G4IIG9_PLABS|nr:hypothetical protein PBRA_003845 [Plasmodiophora brassicae]SPQ94359.1 unnamed protein product [Plasmodiophora brassicae]
MTTDPGDEESAGQRSKSLRSIFSFLDECSENRDQNRKPLVDLGDGSGQPARPPSDVIVDKVKTQLVELKLVNKRNQGRIASLESALQKARKSNGQALERANADLVRKMNEQRVEYEKALERQLQFVDQLLEDKKALTEKGEVLTREIESVRQSGEATLQERERAWAQRIERLRKEWEDGERVRRALWAKEKQDVLRANLQNEVHGKLQSRDTKHAKALRDLAERHEKEMAQLKSVMNREAFNRVQSAKNAMTKEFDEQMRAMEKDRTAELLERSQQHQAEIASVRSILLREFDVERAKWTEVRQREVAEFEEALRMAQQAADDKMAAMKAQHEEAREAWQRKAASDLARAKERFQIEFDERDHERSERLQQELAKREQEYRERLLRERDQQIGVVVEKLSAEASAAKQHAEQQRRRDADASFAKLAECEAMWRARHDELKKAFAKAREAAEQGQLRAGQLQTELGKSKELCDVLQTRVSRIEAERSVSDHEWNERLQSCDQAWAQRLAETETRTKTSSAQTEAVLEELRSRISDAEKQHVSEMMQVEAKVRAAIAKKDNLIVSMRSTIDAQAQRLSLMENALTQQKRDLLNL